MTTTIVVYGVISVSRIMELLSVEPDGDLYANDLAFQILVFVLLKGLPLFVGGVIAVFFQWKYLSNYRVIEKVELIKESA